ncbi:hypothetical protein ACFVMC_03225 [Nocardia sp. NPDC127579]|uniref:hypothetical protein n=1 Tax=Nocardia sp. NPDC127579 TaxID=3345402 RepID=UPI00362B346B
MTDQQPWQSYPAPPPHGQQYPGYGPPPPNRTNTALIVAVVLVIVVVLGVGIAAVVLSRGPAPAEAAAATSTASGTSTTVPPSPPATITVPEFGVAYDLPAGWSADTGPATHTGSLGTLVALGRAAEGPRYCPGSAFRALSFLVAPDVTDLSEAAKFVTVTASESAYSEVPGRLLGAPRSMTTQSGISGRFSPNYGFWTPTPTGCDTKTFSVFSFAFRGPTGATLVLCLAADGGTHKALTDAAAERIIATVRAL